MTYFRNQAVAAILTGLATLAPITLARAADLPSKSVKAVPFTDAPFFFVNDNRLTYAYENTSKAVGHPGYTPKQTVAFTHFDAWAYGTNSVNFGLIKSNQNALAAPCTAALNPGCPGAVSEYLLIRSTLGFNEVFNTKAFSVGPLRNVSFEVGGGESVTNDNSELNIRHLVAGLQFAVDLPYKGYFNVAPVLYKSWYFLSFLTPEGVHSFGPGVPSGLADMRPTWAIEANYYMDLGFLPEYLPLAVSGRGIVIGGMGQWANPNLVSFAFIPPSKSEINVEPIRFTLDASKVVWGPKYSHFVDVWLAYKYRQNAFGLDHLHTLLCVANTCTTSTLYTGITVKF